MKDELDAVTSGDTSARIANVAFDEVDLVRHVCQIGAVPRTEVVQNAYLVSQLDKSRDQMRPDEARSARYQYRCHGRILRNRRFRESASRRRGLAAAQDHDMPGECRFWSRPGVPSAVGCNGGELTHGFAAR